MTVDDDQARRVELRRFLRAHRSRISPAQVGLPVHKGRRAPGLRREEVAELAQISVRWYGEFELGRADHVSAHTVSAIAGVLQLDPTESAYLLRLARAHDAPAEAVVAETVAEVTAERIVHSFTGGLAFVLNRYGDVVAANAAAGALLGCSPGATTRFAGFFSTLQPQSASRITRQRRPSSWRRCVYDIPNASAIRRTTS